MIVCPTMSIRFYYSVLHNTLEGPRFHMIWRCTDEFGSSCSGSERSGLTSPVGHVIREFKTMSHI